MRKPGCWKLPARAARQRCDFASSWRLKVGCASARSGSAGEDTRPNKSTKPQTLNRKTAGSEMRVSMSRDIGATSSSASIRVPSTIPLYVLRSTLLPDLPSQHCDGSPGKRHGDRLLHSGCLQATRQTTSTYDHCSPVTVERRKPLPRLTRPMLARRSGYRDSGSRSTFAGINRRMRFARSLRALPQVNYTTALPTPPLSPSLAGNREYVSRPSARGHLNFFDLAYVKAAVVQHRPD